MRLRDRVNKPAPTIPQTETAEDREDRYDRMRLLNQQIAAFLVRMQRLDDVLGKDWNLYD